MPGVHYKPSSLPPLSLGPPLTHTNSITFPGFLLNFSSVFTCPLKRHHTFLQAGTHASSMEERERGDWEPWPWPSCLCLACTALPPAFRLPLPKRLEAGSWEWSVPVLVVPVPHKTLWMGDSCHAGFLPSRFAEGDGELLPWLSSLFLFAPHFLGRKNTCPWRRRTDGHGRQGVGR